MSAMHRLPAPALADGRSASYSLAAWAGDTLFVTGQIGIDPSGAIVAGGVSRETTQAIANLAAILRTAGLGLENVVKCNVWLAKEVDFDAYDAAYRAAFERFPPARSTMICGLIKGALIEIEAIAHPGEPSTP